MISSLFITNLQLVQNIRNRNEPNMFPIDSSKENMFFYFWNAAHANTVFSITAKPVNRISSCDIQA